MSIETIEQKSKQYQSLLTELNTIAQTVREKINATTDKHIDAMREVKSKLDKLQEEIKEDVSANKSLFKSPKTKTVHCLKLGFRKSKGKLVVEDKDGAIKKIESDYDGAEGVMIKTEKSIIKKGIESLDAKELKRLGISVITGTEQVVFDVVADNIDDFLSLVFEMQS